MDYPGPQGERPTQSGDEPRNAPVFNAPPVVLWTVGILVGSHFAYLFAPVSIKIWLGLNAALMPSMVTAALSGEAGFIGALPPFFTHMLLHAGWLHLSMNCLWLLAFGAPVARRLEFESFIRSQMRRRAAWAFVLLFALSGVSGALAYVVVHPASDALLIGASGGVSGLLGALIRFGIRPAAAPRMAVLPLLHPVILIWTSVIVLMNVALGLLGGGLVGEDANIAWEAHIGGYLFGLSAFPLILRFAAGR